jgi:hypothetical protein
MATLVMAFFLHVHIEIKHLSSSLVDHKASPFFVYRSVFDKLRARTNKIRKVRMMRELVDSINYDRSAPKDARLERSGFVKGNLLRVEQSRKVVPVKHHEALRRECLKMLWSGDNAGLKVITVKVSTACIPVLCSADKIMYSGTSISVHFCICTLALRTVLFLTYYSFYVLKFDIRTLSTLSNVRISNSST